MKHIFDVAVVGGGLHGLSAALHLTRRSLRVLVLERSWSGRHSSGATAAGVRALGRDMAELQVSLEALEMWRNIEKLVGDDCGFAANGQMRIAEHEKALDALLQGVNRLHANGYKHEVMIDPAEVKRRVPALGVRCLGAAFTPGDGAADPHRTIAAFRKSCLLEGVTISEGCGVSSIERTGLDWTITKSDGGTTTVPMIVNAAGAWGSEIAKMVGDDIPMGLKASMMMVTERLNPFLAPVVSSYGRQLSFKQADQGGLVIGGGIQGDADLPAETSHVRFGRLAKGAKDAVTLFPSVREVRIVRTWAGLEATTSDHLPIIGASENGPGVFHAYGFSGHGFALVPVVGAIMADLVHRGSTTRDIEGLQASRLMHVAA
ncbi:NAD(P)/FAD-dependent oxidoreductase [Paraburkholderia phytofirmans]|uniref:FAD dependent oxidoreductase n=1 Tax=Paraburkholderia phytofirmans (strain DSM 17436 / LMG 22146 / PsJN) TaxID=398527 RepID=B2TB93_PARPJ|nr:FAD-dependent oxidoreductase [Paraburkholderia phytofirmans]ACD20835.1 FAD dependent oxidoreductase [Paraburkholderia phytofirmans PsJN]